jgi:hypothetical protein
MKRIKNPTLECYAHTQDDPWRWRPAAGTDTQAIEALAHDYFKREPQPIYRWDSLEYSRNVLLATVNQFYNPRRELISVATHVDTGQLLAYTWAMRDQRAPWSTEEMVAPRMAHVDLALPIRARVHLVAQMIRMWETWAAACDIAIICSSTIRQDAGVFMRLHERAGYYCLGSVAYLRRSTATFAVDLVTDPSRVVAHSTYNASDYSQAGREHSIGSDQFRAAD